MAIEGQKVESGEWKVVKAVSKNLSGRYSPTLGTEEHELSQSAESRRQLTAQYQ